MHHRRDLVGSLLRHQRHQLSTLIEHFGLRVFACGQRRLVVEGFGRRNNDQHKRVLPEVGHNFSASGRSRQERRTNTANKMLTATASSATTSTASTIQGTLLPLPLIGPGVTRGLSSCSAAMPQNVPVCHGPGGSVRDPRVRSAFRSHDPSVRWLHPLVWTVRPRRTARPPRRSVASSVVPRAARKGRSHPD